MKVQEDVKPISYFKAHAAEVPEKIKDSIGMLKLLSLSEQAIRDGKILSQSSVESRLQKKFNL